jgi:hypothetical protein
MEMKKKYAAPQPTSAIYTMKDRSQTYADVLKLQDKYGFEYAGAVGSLIWLINCYPKLNFAVRKLPRFMTLPGERHFKLLRHLLYHVKCFPEFAAIKFYADPSMSPLHRKLRAIDAEWVCDHPIIAVSNASFQDCPDTSRSTGGFIIHLQGGTIQEVTTSPQIICHSTGEAEYCTAALAIMAAAHLRKAFNEITNRPSDSPLTIPIGIDSKAAADIASSAKETKKTRHIERRYHVV